MPYKDPARRKAYQATYAAAHYQRNKPAYYAAAKAHDAKMRAAINAWLLAYLRKHPCLDCGEPDPIVLEFDHRDPADKLFSIAAWSNEKMPLRRVIEEVAKCDVRCANCHRRKTYRERGHANKG